MQILGFDQSTLITGWAVFKGGEYLAHGTIDLHKHKNAERRFEKMCLEIKNTIDDWNPDEIVVEDVMLMKSPQTMKLLARIQGVIIGFCIDKNIPFHIYLPTEWRKSLGFKQGKVSREQLKQQAIDLVSDSYGLSVNSDEADAICIAMAYIKNLEETTNGKEN